MQTKQRKDRLARFGRRYFHATALQREQGREELCSHAVRAAARILGALSWEDVCAVMNGYFYAGDL